MYRKDLIIGEKFGDRVVIEQLEERKHGYVWYLVKCKCGNISKLSGSYLRQYPNKKCNSCTKLDKSPKGKNHCNFKHGLASRSLGKDRLYHIWVCMRQRCNNPNAKQYKDYGGRGITICKEWDSIEQFVKDMGERPSIRHTLDRIDNNKGYCKENCRWATFEEQARNKRNNRLYKLPDGTRIVKQALIDSLEWTNDMFKRRIKSMGLPKILEMYQQKINKPNVKS